MATFKEPREILLASYASNIITTEEYALLFEENCSNNLDFPYYNYPPFNLESQSEAECRANFRVEKHHIPLVEDALQIPQYFVCDQGTVCEGTEGLCMLLKRYSFPCRYSDMIPIFGRPVPELCTICNTVTGLVFEAMRTVFSCLFRNMSEPDKKIQRENAVQRVRLKQGRDLFTSRSCAVVINLVFLLPVSFSHVRVVGS